MDTVCPALSALTLVTPSKFVAPLIVFTSGLVANDMNGGKFEIAKDCPDTVCTVPLVRVNRKSTRSDVSA